jgi:hypothetical protein
MFRKYWEEKPLTLIIIASAFFRLLAVIFSKGYAFHDDHFLVIEAAQSWVDGYDYNNWLPIITKSVAHPSGHSLFYPGLHYLLFRFLQFIGIYDPQIKMYFVRFLHAVLSMSVVYFGYKIADRFGSIKAAKTAGILLGILFFTPMMSVRNLVEFVCIPPLIYATWLIIRNESEKTATPTHFLTFSPALLAGLMLGLAFSIRFQTALFLGGFVLALLLQKRWKQAIAVCTGLIVSIAVVQAATDMIIWHRPFMEFGEYIRWNIAYRESYIGGHWYNYILLIAGILIPPISLFLLFGFVRSWRKHLILFLPSFIFLVFHSYFPNRQERFILPIIPFIIVLGSVGWHEFMQQSIFWINHKKLYRNCWIFFWSINTIPLIFVSTAYSHRSRVESMIYLSQKNDFKNLIVEESQHDGYNMMPLFYLRHWQLHDLYLTKIFPADSLIKKMAGIAPDPQPNYVVFNQTDDIEERVKNFKKIYPNIQYETTIEPGLVDDVMHRLNPNNANYTTYIYRITGESEKVSR